MSNYSLTVRLSGFSRAQIKRNLRTAFGSAVAQEAQIVDAGKLPDYYEACRANRHFGCVHWTDEDIKFKLRDLKIPKTLRIIEAAKSSYALRHIGDRMVELGWEVMEESILDAARNRLKVGKQSG
jgi:hypothetical protein